MERSVQISKEMLAIRDAHQFTDAHCHLDLYENPSEVIGYAKDKGVTTIITAGSNRASNVKILELASDGIFGVVGISPDFSDEDFEFIEELTGIVKKNKNIIGIGEIGLDMKIAETVRVERQREAFDKQIEIAGSLGLPIVVHSRNAMGEVMKTLEEREVRRAVFHFFEGNVDQARMLAKKGYLISIPPGESSRRRRVIKELELSSIVAETDSPAVGKTPADVINVIELIAGLKRLDPGEVGDTITETIKDYFYI